ncbi:MAG: methyltransferase domain-containing protein [Lentisphaeria bacterium]
MVVTAATPFAWTPAARTALAAFNSRWEEHFARFRRTTGAPWWAPGLILTPELRRQHELALPQDRYRRDLAAVAARLLPGRAWLPRLLCDPDAVLSLPDLWSRLPPRLAGLSRLDEAACGALLCALADPPRFGTDTGRYPEQLAEAAAWLRDRPATAWRALDLGCGTGHGTWELAAAAAGHGTGTVVGATREPLEAWMAASRRLPHDSGREHRFPAPPPAAAGRVHFVAADALAPPFRPHRFDLILVNGLAGGPHLCAPDAMGRLLGALARLAAPGGRIACACRFHDGYAPDLAAFAAQARRNGWQVDGPPRRIWLRPPDNP